MLSLGFVLAGFSSEIWQLALTQGLMSGIGVGWVRVFDPVSLFYFSDNPHHRILWPRSR
jgi:hypothetical protein